MKFNAFEPRFPQSIFEKHRAAIRCIDFFLLPDRGVSSEQLDVKKSLHPIAALCFFFSGGTLVRGGVALRPPSPPSTPNWERKMATKYISATEDPKACGWAETPLQ